MLTLADAVQVYPKQKLGFELKRTKGFSPPAPIQNLSTSVDLDLSLGAHYFFTFVHHRTPTFGLVEDFINFSTTVNGIHTFDGSGFGDDAESSQSYSAQFAKLVGVAFMAQYANCTWFASMSRMWRDGLVSATGRIEFKKRHPKSNGPDYLAAPFDPASATSDPLYVVEFKGRTGVVKFSHEAFRAWRKQSKNIRAYDPNGVEVNLKSWVLAFNYAFEGGEGRENSTLLVEDPWTAPANVPALGHDRRAVSRIIREHLARQCPKFGLGHLSRALVTDAGQDLSALRLPGIFTVHHPRLGVRRYVGGFATRGPDGNLFWLPDGWLDGRLRHDVDIEIFPSSQGGDWFEFLVHVRGRSSRSRRAFVRVFGQARPPAPVELRRMLRELLGGSTTSVFVGQDATMIRECLRTPIDAELGGISFSEPIELAGTTEYQETTGYVQVLRNGGIVAGTDLVSLEEDSDAWWRAT